jgi:hypothetical protein
MNMHKLCIKMHKMMVEFLSYVVGLRIMGEWGIPH